MVLVAHGIVMKLESWAWGCPCHARLVDPGASWSRRSRVFRKQSPTSTFATCPMRGRRVAELAAGHVDSCLERHGAIAASEVILMTQGLQVADRDRILQDFGRARRHLEYIITLKLAIFQNLPHKVMALAHTDMDVARKSCQ